MLSAHASESASEQSLLRAVLVVRDLENTDLANGEMISAAIMSDLALLTLANLLSTTTLFGALRFPRQRLAVRLFAVGSAVLTFLFMVVNVLLVFKGFDLLIGALEGKSIERGTEGVRNFECDRPR